MATMAEAKIRATTYTGEKHRWNFEKYMKVLVDQHTVLENLPQHGYDGVDLQTKVRHLVDGIKTDKLDSIKMAIMASAALRIDFFSFVNLFKDFIKQTGASNVKEVTIATFNVK